MKPKRNNMTVGELIDDLSIYPKSAEIQLCVGPDDDQMLAILSIYGDGDESDENEEFAGDEVAATTTVFIDLGEYLA